MSPLTFCITVISVAGVLAASPCISQTVENPLRIGGDVKPPVVIKEARPKFSPKMRKEPTEKDVIVHLVVDEQGHPAKARVLIRDADFLTADPEFGNSALEAVEHYRFKPATREGKPVAVEINVDVHFQIISR